MATWTTRTFAVGCLLLVVVSTVAAGGLVSLAAPFSGSAWETIDDRGPSTVETPYGPASVTYDDRGVPHIEAESTEALYYAVGYVQARDRLFQMDLFRRLMEGRLSSVFGNSTVGSDRFHRQMDFERAASVKWERLRNTSVGPPVEAYSAGVNHYIETGPLPPEFSLNDYEPTAWTPEDTIVVGMRATWGLSGDFNDLKKATISEHLPSATELYPDQLDHDSSIFELASSSNDGRVQASLDAPRSAVESTDTQSGHDYSALYESVEGFDRQPGIGSNNWVVSGNMTESGEPILANDPHLSLLAPPVWYEMQLSSPDLNVHGVAFPGIPMTLIGQTQNVSWGITNVGADVTDVYRYEWRDDGRQYYHQNGWRNATVQTETIDVAGGPDRTVEVRKTVHGPVLQREGQTVAVSWLGLTDTREPLAFYEFNRADNMSAFREATRNFDLPASNIVAMSDDGQTFYRPSGTYPIRRTDGTVVPGDQVFNGSADEGTWEGFVPYGESDLTGPGFVDYETVPQMVNPEMVSTANQRVADDIPFYLGTSVDFADPYRGERIDELLEQSLNQDGQLTVEEMQMIQRDVDSLLARQYTPFLRGAAGNLSGEARDAAVSLVNWDHEMTAESTEALLFDRWLAHFRNMTFSDEYYSHSLDESYYPKRWTLGELPADSQWYDDIQTRERETRADIAARAMEAALGEIDREGWETYGDVNQLDLNHPFGSAAEFLSYEEAPMDGGPFTVFNFRAESSPQAGSSWRMITQPDQTAMGIVPGGNDGVYWSEHYSDQLDLWREGEYRPLWTDPDGEPDITFEEDDQ